MKRGAKITVFIASMALTVGSLAAFSGQRHCGHGLYRHAACMSNSVEHGHWGYWQGAATDSAAKQ